MTAVCAVYPVYGVYHPFSGGAFADYLTHTVPSSTHNNYNCTAPSLLPHQGGPSLPQEVTRGEWEVTRLLAWAGDTL